MTLRTAARRRAARAIIASAVLGTTGLGQAQPAAPKPPADTQGADETVWDPELDGPKPTTPDPSATQGADETVWDPELDGARPSATAKPPSPKTEVAPTEDDSLGAEATSTELRGFLATRIGVDTDWTTPGEEVIEATQVAQLEMIHHPNDTLGIGVGLRARHILGLRRDAVEGDGESRTGLDLVPVAGFVDTVVGDSGNLRAGYQIIELGRFDVFSASNFLAVHDLRSGPVTMPEASHVAQPAVRLDLDPDEHLTLTGIYVPFFTPHIVDVTGSDYSPVGVALGAGAQQPTNQAILDALGGSESSEASRGVLRALAPDPDLMEPQGAIRATLSGAPGEISATAGTALERLPSLAFSGPAATPTVEVIHERFYVTSVDAATDIGPVQIGAEAAYMFDRTFTAWDGNTAFPAEAGQTDVLQLGLRGELVEGEGFVAVLEGFTAFALDDPSDATQRWLTLDEGNRMYGVAGGFQWSLGTTGVTLELGGVLLNGPTYAAIPRVEYEAVQGLFVEIGALAVGGKRMSTAPLDASLGGLFEGTDQVFTGVRWVP